MKNIIDMKITHRKNVERRKRKLRNKYLGLDSSSSSAPNSTTTLHGLPNSSATPNHVVHFHNDVSALPNNVDI